MNKEQALKDLSFELHCNESIKYKGLKAVLAKTISAFDSGATEDDISRIFLEYLNDTPRSPDRYY
jgi:hypothetical protein